MSKTGSFCLLLLLSSALCWGNIAINGSLARDYEVQPAGYYEGTVELVNPSDTSQEVKIYQTDYMAYADGRVLFGDPGLLPRSNARWVTFSPAQVTVPAGETAVVRYAVQVPDDASLKGSYWSMLMVEPIPEGSPESTVPEPGKISLSLIQVLRYGLQIVTQVGQTGTTQVQFADVQLSTDAGTRVLVADVANTGDRWFVGHLWVELYDVRGKLVGKFDAGAKRMFPGSSVRFSSPLTGIQDADYQALIVVDCGGDDVFGANVNIVASQ